MVTNYRDGSLKLEEFTSAVELMSRMEENVRDKMVESFTVMKNGSKVPSGQRADFRKFVEGRQK